MKSSKFDLVELGFVTKVITGQSPEGKYYNKEGVGLPFYQGKKEFTNKYLGQPFTWTTKVTKEAIRDDILMSVRAPVGPVNISTEKICIGRGLAAIRPKNRINRDFLFYFLQLKEAEIQGTTGAVFNSISKKNIEEIKIPLPTLPEQQRIVAILDQAFAAIATAKANAEKNLQNARELFETYLNKIFTNPTDDWEEKSLGEIADIKGGKRVPKGYRLETKVTDHPYIRVTDFNDQGSIDLSDIHYINDEVHEQIKNYTISENDLYISIAGTIGKTGMVPRILNRANLTENACKLVFKKNIEPRFVYYFTKTSSFLSQAGLNTRVAAMPKLALSRLSTIKLNIPNEKSDQQNIIAKLDTLIIETKKLEMIYQQKMSTLEEMKNSILHKAFSGALTEG